MKKTLKRDFSFPQVGIGVMIFKNGKMLIGQRKGSHGSGEYSFPGGHLEYGESFEGCARREVEEETELKIKNVKFQFIANVKKYDKKHYVHIGLIADWKSGAPRNTEPEKSSDWSWVDPKKPPKPLFEMCRLALKSLKNKKKYFDS